MNPRLPEEPKFVKIISSLQKVLAGIAVTMIMVVWITGFDFVLNVFRPDYIKSITFVRVSIAIGATVLVSVIGYQQIGYIIRIIVELYEFYKTMSEIKKKKNEE